MKKPISVLLLFITVFFVGCYKTETNEVYPKKESSITFTNKNARPDGGITTMDAPAKVNSGTVQFQWGANNQFIVSEPWRAVDEFLTVDQKLEILLKAYNKIGIIQGTAQNKLDFKCTYDKAVNIIRNSGTINYGYRSNNFVYQCCPACGDRIEGKNVNKARCDFAIAKGGF